MIAKLQIILEHSDIKLPKFMFIQQKNIAQIILYLNQTVSLKIQRKRYICFLCNLIPFLIAKTKGIIYLPSEAEKAVLNVHEHRERGERNNDFFPLLTCNPYGSYPVLVLLLLFYQQLPYNSTLVFYYNDTIKHSKYYIFILPAMLPKLCTLQAHHPPELHCKLHYRRQALLHHRGRSLPKCASTRRRPSRKTRTARFSFR